MSKRIFIALLLLPLSLTLAAQSLAVEDLEIIEEDLPTGDVRIFAVFNGYCPITLTLDFPELKNFKPSQSVPFQEVVHPREEKQLLVLLRRIKKTAPASYGFAYGFTIGDGINARHDDHFVYRLPFPDGKKYLMGQGNNGRFSHRGVNAVDFNMPTGTEVCAARKGVVVDYRESSTVSCKSPSCQDEANFIIIYHDDGSFGHYGHLEKNGVLVELGQEVNAGQVIGKSGNTGWSSGPHLHFEVFVPQGSQQMTIPVNFGTGQGKRETLKEGKFYTATPVR